MSDGIRRCFQLIVYCMSRSYIHVLQARLSNRTARNCPCRPHDINFAQSSTQPEETSISASSRISNLTHRSYLESLTIQKVDCASVMNIMNVYFPTKTHHNMEFPRSMLIWTNQLRLIPALSWPLWCSLDFIRDLNHFHLLHLVILLQVNGIHPTFAATTWCPLDILG